MHTYRTKPRLTPLAAIILCTLSIFTPPTQADGILCNGRRIIGWLPTARSSGLGEITSSSSNMAINGSTAYVQLSQIYLDDFGISWGSIIGIVDISNPEAPILIDSGFGFNPNRFNDITISNDILYIANSFDTITLYDISNPLTPRYLSSITPQTPLSITLPPHSMFVSKEFSHTLPLAQTGYISTMWPTHQPRSSSPHTTHQATLTMSPP